MPQWLLERFAQEMAPIAADESLRRVQELQVGCGTIARQDARRVLSRWQRAARKGPRKPMTEAEWRGRLAVSGIKLKVIGKDER